MDSIKQIVRQYVEAVDSHQIGQMIAVGKVNREILNAFAVMHYGFSTSWGPVIGMVKDRAVNPKFREALAENMRDELGVNGTSHISLCYDMLTSMRLVPHYAGNDMIAIASHPTEIMNAVGELTEAQAAGYMLSSESLVPHVFSLFRPAFVAIGADTRYLDEHIGIDVGKHSQMLEEAVEAVCDGSADIASEVEQGVHFGGRSIVGPIDCLYFKALQIDAVTRKTKRTVW